MRKLYFTRFGSSADNCIVQEVRDKMEVLGIKTLRPPLNFFELIQGKKRFTQVGAAADRTAPRPGQAFTLAKNELTIEAGRRCQNQSLASGFQGLLQKL